MKVKQLLLVDLDGTITNPEEGITKAIRYAMEQLELPALSQEQLRNLLGHR